MGRATPRRRRAGAGAPPDSASLSRVESNAPSKRFPIKDARERKAARSKALSDLACGALSPAAVVREPPEALERVDVYDALLHCASLGRESVRQVLERARVWPHTRLGELSPEQRGAIIACLPPRAIAQ